MIGYKPFLGQMRLAVSDQTLAQTMLTQAPTVPQREPRGIPSWVWYASATLVLAGLVTVLIIDPKRRKIFWQGFPAL